jgi:glucuronoarabinoxylan endo-1,4-beta-xylanase
VSAILKDVDLSAILSDEGAIPFPRYGDEPTGVETEPERSPQGSMMFQNFPNPFNPRTVVRYQLPAESDTKLLVYDLLGHEVALLVNGRTAAGIHDVEFDASRLSSGVYITKLIAGNLLQTRKMVLVR